MSLADLSSELVQEICEILDDDRKSLKALRLVSRSISGNATLQLFRTIRLNMLRRSWQNADRIAHQPGLAQCVKEIQLVHLNPHCGVREMWAWERGAITQPYIPKTFQTIHGSPIQPIERHRPDINLTLLSKLRTVKSADWRDLEANHEALIEFTQPRGYDFNAVFFPKGRSVFETPLFYEFFSCIWGNRVQIETLHLQQLLEFLREPMFPMAYRFNTCKELRNLSIDLFVPIRTDLSTLEWRLEPWIIELEMLESFKLSQGQCGHGQCNHSHDVLHCENGSISPRDDCRHVVRLWPSVNLIKLFRSVRWPQLRHLHLRYPLTTIPDLQTFLLLHAATLQTLRIEYPLVGPTEWRKFLAWLPTSTLRLTQFEYTDAFSGPMIFSVCGDYIIGGCDPEELDFWFDRNIMWPL